MAPGRGTSERRWHVSPIGALLISVTAGILVGCGVTFGSGGRGSEFFQQLSVTGDFATGGQLTLAVQYSQAYPVSLNVVCDLLDPDKPTPTKTVEPTRPNIARLPTSTPTPPAIPGPATTPVKRVLQILDETIAPNAAAPTVTNEKEPFQQVTPVVSTLTRAFQAPEQAGTYVVRCMTPADDNNQIRKTIVIRGG
jgi:hypothetical protein